jgi:hypothetical protein
MLVVALLVSHMKFGMFIGKLLNVVRALTIMLEEFNRRMNSIFPTHPHIYNFIKCLGEEHEFQHHRVEESLY